ncbi:porin family protein [Laspinema olomoucense]|uniref:porin family protein n=1 Tax=Laspinema olomoucense TaxID=3231600 RepID=UPI0021BB6CF7|nr:porin family protein [Laspinema sp. D3a]MCT7989171.1 porin family protein [Laspinema sp. D3a]
MERLKKIASSLGALLLGTGAIASSLALWSQPASAQAAYGSYIGIGGSAGISELDGDRQNSFLLAARYKLLPVPISLRAQAFFSGDGTAVVPTISYDYPLTWQTDIYLGAGAALTTGDTPVGQKVSFAIQPGVDFAVPNTRFIVFGNAVIALDAYEDESKPAVSVQGGVGLRF